MIPLELQQRHHIGWNSDDFPLILEVSGMHDIGRAGHLGVFCLEMLQGNQGILPCRLDFNRDDVVPMEQSGMDFQFRFHEIARSQRRFFHEIARTRSRFFHENARSQRCFFHEIAKYRQDQSHRPAAVPGGAAQRLPSRCGGAGDAARQIGTKQDKSRQFQTIHDNSRWRGGKGMKRPKMAQDEGKDGSGMYMPESTLPSKKGRFRAVQGISAFSKGGFGA